MENQILVALQVLAPFSTVEVEINYGLITARIDGREFQVNETPDADAEVLFNEETDLYFETEDGTEYVAIRQ